jgi:hypothetical protein
MSIIVFPKHYRRSSGQIKHILQKIDKDRQENINKINKDIDDIFYKYKKNNR